MQPMNHTEQIASGLASGRQTLNRQNWKVTLAYDGTDFHGWQVQPGKPTIQGELHAALGRITGETPLPQGSGRTDAGVHALAQVASFALNVPIPPANLRRALNRTLPPSIRVNEAGTVPATFHARHSAISKTYEYRIFREEICPPFLARFVFPCLWPLDFAALEGSARLFLGEHDFQSFAATDPDLAARTAEESECSRSESGALECRLAGKVSPGSTVRTIFASAWERHAAVDGELRGELWTYRVRGNGFLHHMVRNLVGTMLDAARGNLAVNQIPEILSARSRSAAGPTAPARGLFLHSVEYPRWDLPVEDRLH